MRAKCQGTNRSPRRRSIISKNIDANTPVVRLTTSSARQLSRSPSCIPARPNDITCVALQHRVHRQQFARKQNTEAPSHLRAENRVPYAKVQSLHTGKSSAERREYRFRSVELQIYRGPHLHRYSTSSLRCIRWSYTWAASAATQGRGEYGSS